MNKKVTKEEAKILCKMYESELDNYGSINYNNLSYKELSCIECTVEFVLFILSEILEKTAWTEYLVKEYSAIRGDVAERLLERKKELKPIHKLKIIRKKIKHS